MFTVSVLHNSNRILASSQDNLNHIRDGSFIKIDRDNILYDIARINKNFIIKDFEIKSPKLIIINEDIGITLQKNDIIKIAYKEYELDTIINIKNKGKFYALEDLLVVKNGESIVDIQNGLSHPTKLTVERTDELGGVLQLGLKDKGRYIIPPSGDIELIGGHGESLILDLKYDMTFIQSVLERTIEDIQVKENKTYILLDYSLPNGINKGKLSTEKWEILLNTNYVGNTKINVNYEIYKDFTPNLKLPYLVKNSQSQEIIFNKAMTIIDNEIIQLKRKLGMC